jgi:molybdate transport repressor ModE-like protein
VTTRVPDLDGLRLLVAVAATGSIGAAARQVGITQQSASQRLRSVESQVGFPLVLRAARGSRLTEGGVVVVEWARRLLDLAEEIDHALEGLRGDRDRELSVWSSMTVAESLLPGWLVRLRQRQAAEGRTPTSVGLVATNSEAVQRAVRDGVADLGFVEGAAPPSDLRWTAVRRDELVLVTAGGTPLSRRRTPLQPGEVARLSLTAREAGSGTRDVVEQALRGHGLRLGEGEPLVELTTGTAVRGAVLAGGPPAFLSRGVVEQDLRSGSLVEVPVADLDLTRLFRAVWSGAERPPAGPVRDLIGIARAAS